MFFILNTINLENLAVASLGRKTITLPILVSSHKIPIFRVATTNQKLNYGWIITLISM